MIIRLLSLGDMPAGEGLSGVISSALLAFGTLALIYLVLVLLDRYHKKHGKDDNSEKPHNAGYREKSFPEVLSEQLEKTEDENKDKHI